MQGELQPVHMAASLGHTDILQYLASLPDVDPAVKCQTVGLLSTISQTCNLLNGI